MLHDESGVVLGDLFRSDGRSDVKTHPELDADTSARILATGGRYLTENFWGSYVAFLRDRTRRATRVIRDPTGALECLLTSCGNVRICFSSMRDCKPLDRIDFSVNWDYIATMLGFQLMLDTRETGLNEITRIAGGECLTIERSSMSIDVYWDPFEIVRTGSIDDVRTAAARLRTTVKGVTHAWASRYDSILHLLSGGLDSSIILGCLTDAPSVPSVVCINNYYSRGSNSDERSFARLAAHRAAVRLVEFESNPNVDLRSAIEIAPAASPSDIVTGSGSLAQIRQTSKDFHAQALFSGVGGDEVFFETGLRYVCADRIYRRRFDAMLARSAFQISRLAGNSVWHTLAKGLRDGLTPNPLTSILGRFKPSQLVTPMVAERITEKRLFVHPRIVEASVAGVSPGKIWQILCLSHANEPALNEPGDPDQVNPLFSQPVIELCLRIPTELLAAEGWGRFLARRAFSPDVPNEILWRRSKCVVDELTKHIVSNNILFIREILHDSALVRAGLIDQTKLRAALDSTLTKNFGYALEICRCLSVELWLSHWAQRQRKAIAA